MNKSILNISIFIVILICILCSPSSNAQTTKRAKQLDQITLKVSAEGTTKEEAINNALRSAVEQACGVFVSSNTTIFNDELIKDEVVMLSSGNVMKYSEISSFILPDNRQHVLIEATVSLQGIVKYVESKGVTASFAGNSFAATMKLRELNSQAEIKVAHNLILQIKELAPTMYDLTLDVDEPKVSTEGYVIPMKVSFVRNANTENVFNLIFSTLSSLSLTESEIADYEVNNIPVYQYRFGVSRIKYSFADEGDGISVDDMFSEMKNTGDVAEITLKSNKMFSSEKHMFTKQMKIGELYKNLDIYYWRRTDQDLSYTHMMRCAFREKPTWLATLAGTIINQNIDFIITDNLGNKLSINSPGMRLSEDPYSNYCNYASARIPALLPLRLEFCVSKDEISKYSSFTVSHKE